MDYVKQWLTARLIKADFEEKKTGQTKYIKLTEKDLYKLFIKFIKIIENYIEKTN